MNNSLLESVLTRMASEGNFLIGKKQAESMASTIMDLINYSNANPNKEITLYVSASFSDFTTAAILYDAIKSISNTVNCIALGLLNAFSCLVVAGCTKGKRAALKHTEFNLLEPRGILDAGANLETEISLISKESKEIRDELERLLALETSQDINKIHQLISDEADLDVEDAKNLGIIDQVI